MRILAEKGKFKWQVAKAVITMVHSCPLVSLVSEVSADVIGDLVGRIAGEDPVRKIAKIAYLCACINHLLEKKRICRGAVREQPWDCRSICSTSTLTQQA
jgi:hypothetical protein